MAGTEAEDREAGMVEGEAAAGKAREEDAAAREARVAWGKVAEVAEGMEAGGAAAGEGAAAAAAAAAGEGVMAQVQDPGQGRGPEEARAAKRPAHTGWPRTRRL